MEHLYSSHVTLWKSLTPTWLRQLTGQLRRETNMISEFLLAITFYNFTPEGSLFHCWKTHSIRESYFFFHWAKVHSFSTNWYQLCCSSFSLHTKVPQVFGGNFHLPWSYLFPRLINFLSSVHELVLTLCICILNSFDTSIQIYNGFEAGPFL